MMDRVYVKFGDPASFFGISCGKKPTYKMTDRWTHKRPTQATTVGIGNHL